MVRKIFYILFFLELVVSDFTSYSQILNNSDSHLLSIINESRLRGLNENELFEYAKSKGYSDFDIKRVMSSQNSNKTTNTNILSSYSKGLSQKQFANLNEDESLRYSLDSSSLLTNEEKKIFGFEVFRNKAISFAPNLNMATPTDYIVGPGDELIVQVYGLAQATINLKVSPEGKALIPDIGLYHLGGLSIDAVKTLLTKKLGLRYAGFIGSIPNSFISVTLSNVRSIKVNIVGDVKNPGTYQFPSFTNCFNALYATGGPTVNGSFRNIQVFRSGKKIADVDLYDFLLHGKTDKNIRLEDNDVILVPHYLKRVEISGEVRRNLFFEIKDNETLTDLVYMSNGFTNQAYTKSLTIQRFKDGEKSILNVLEKNQSSTPLYDGDFIYVGKSPLTFINRVQISGAVIREGDYELTQNYTINDLVYQAGGLKQDAYKSRAILYRTGNDLKKTIISIDLNKSFENDTANNIVLKKEDLLVVPSIYDLKESYFVSIYGEVNKTGVFPYSIGISLRDLIFLAGGFKDAASESYIEIARRVKNEKNSIAKIINIDLSEGLLKSQNEVEFKLEPFDQVFVRSSIGYKEPKKVFVQGESNYTGPFVMDKMNMTVSDLIKRAGGVLPSANLEGAILIRRTIFFKKGNIDDDYLNNLIELRSRYMDSSLSGLIEASKIELTHLKKRIDYLSSRKTAKENPIDEIKSPSQRMINIGDISDSLNSLMTNKLSLLSIENLKTSLQSKVIRNLNNVPYNEDQYQFVSINLDKIINSNKTLEYDLQLQEGDILYIPSLNETVNVSGDVLYPVALKYIKDASLKEYVNKAGGFKSTAIRSKSYVVQANGSVKRTYNFLGLKLYPKVLPGSQIFVPQSNMAKSKFSLDRMFGLVSSLVTTYLLLQNLTK